MMLTETRDVRGIPLWLMREYLVELGGQAQADDLVAGPDWTARLSQLPDFRIGSLVVGEVRLEIEAATERLPALRLQLDRKLIRAGG